jgi:hypothetical protein
MSSVDIDKIKKDLQNLSEDIKVPDVIKSVLQNKYKYLYATYPRLFKMILDGGDIRIALSMLDKLKKVNDGSMSFDKASENIGQEMFNKYVKHLDKPN